MKQVLAVLVMACALPSLAIAAESPLHPTIVEGASVFWKGMSGIVSSITNHKSAKLADLIKKGDFEESARYYEEETPRSKTGRWPSFRRISCRPERSDGPRA
jgi:hypothetical protein